jgi:hypothetical protein
MAAEEESFPVPNPVFTFDVFGHRQIVAVIYGHEDIMTIRGAVGVDKINRF